MIRELYYGDNLEVLRNKIKPESVDLCYIDPPFNSKRNYFQIYNNIGSDDKAQAQAFIDTWTWDTRAIEGYEEIITNSQGKFSKQTIELIKGLRNVLGHDSLLAYMVSMALRIAQIHRALKDTGSFYLHCDPTCSHYLKLILDSIFCANGGDYLNEISWQRTRSVKKQSNRFGRTKDIIFLYAKRKQFFTFNGQFLPLRDEYIKSHYRYIEKDTGKYYRLDNFAQAGQGEPKKFGDKIIPPPNGKHWIWSQERIDDAIDKGLIVFSKNGTPNVKRYLDNIQGEYVQDIWTDITEINSQSKERLGYPTQKPEALLERIIRASSNEGDTVLDAYCGCGTTVAVAERLKRNWIGIDITYQSISLVLKRLEDTFGETILQGIRHDGIPQDIESAIALSQKKDDRVRKEFEKWAVLTYSNNRAAINMKKGADKGIDGTAYFATSHYDTGKIVFQVKSGNVNRSVISSLRGDMEREGAEIAVLITLEEPTKPMKDEAKIAGIYEHQLMGRNYDRIQIVTVKEIVEEYKRLDMPVQWTVDTVKEANGRGGEVKQVKISRYDKTT